MNIPVRVSVITPVYNAGPYLRAFVDSFLQQSLSPEAIELIAVNDGSTDDSGSILDSYAAMNANVTVIHQANSGWPGGPRNVGLDRAQGDYVFFADPDDEFGGPEALERLVEFADQHGSDIVVPKMIPRGGRRYAQWRYASTQIDADLVTCFTTLTPQKLFRRDFLDAEGIRFPEEKVRLEDGQFLSVAYLLAKRVSILTGYDFYVLIHHQQQNHLSATAVDPESYIESVTVMSRNVEKHCADADTADRIINEIYFRKVLSNFTNSRVANHSLAHRQKWLDAQRRYVDRFISDARFAKMDDVAKVRTDLVRAGDLDAIVAYARAEKLDFEFSSSRSRRGRLELQGTLIGGALDGDLPQLIVVNREQKSDRRVLEFQWESDGVIARIPKSTLPPTDGEDRYDLWVCAGRGHQDHRISGPKRPFNRFFTDDREIELYTTNQGNLSVAVRPGLSRQKRLQRRIRRVVGR